MESPVTFSSRLVLALLLVGICALPASGSDSQALIIDMLMGEPVSMKTMIEDLATVRVIYIGEVHSIARHHTIQANLIRELAQQGVKLALAMEMFAREQQPILDRWQHSNDDIGRLISELGTERWTNIKDYESLIIAARDLKIPILGLNASDELVRKVSRKGVEGLTELERRKLPTGYDTINPVGERLLRLKLQVHRAFQEKGLDNVVLAQAVRDETMAQAVVSFLNSPVGKDRIVVVIAGGGHVNYGLGIPERVQRRESVLSRIILISESGELVLSEEEKRHAVPVDIRHEDLRFIRSPIADYLHVAPLQDPNASREDQGKRQSK